MHALIRKEIDADVPAAVLWDYVTDWPRQAEWIPLTRVEVVDGRVRVTDLHSTNGTRVLTPDGQAFELEPGIASEVAGGSTLLLGEFAVRLDRAPLHTV